MTMSHAEFVRTVLPIIRRFETAEALGAIEALHYVATDAEGAVRFVFVLRGMATAMSLGQADAELFITVLETEFFEGAS